MQVHAMEEAAPPFRNPAKPAQLARHEEIAPARGVSGQQPLLRGLSAPSALVTEPPRDTPRRFTRNRFLFHRPIRKKLEELLVERACVLPYPIGPEPPRARRRVVKLPVIGQQAGNNRTLGEPLDKSTVERILANSPRPTTRGQCADGPRPCPWVSCRHHLMLDVHPTSGAIKLNHRRLEDMQETCSLDVAQRDEPLTLAQVGELVGVTNERARQIMLGARARFDGLKRGEPGDV